MDALLAAAQLSLWGNALASVDVWTSNDNKNRLDAWGQAPFINESNLLSSLLLWSFGFLYMNRRGEERGNEEGEGDMRSVAELNFQNIPIECHLPTFEPIVPFLQST